MNRIDDAIQSLIYGIKLFYKVAVPPQGVPLQALHHLHRLLIVQGGGYVYYDMALYRRPIYSIDDPDAQFDISELMDALKTGFN